MKKWYVIVAVMLAFIMIASSGAVAVSSSKIAGTSSSVDSGSVVTSSSSSSGDLQDDDLIISQGTNSDGNYITPYPPPLNEEPFAEIVSIGPNPAFVGEQVSFVGRGRDPENETKYFSWDFNGDGTWEVLNDPVDGTGWVSHYAYYTYEIPSDPTMGYMVKLRVMDVEEEIDYDYGVVVAVNITVDINNNFAGQSTMFTAVVQGFSPTSYSWTFGDGETASSETYCIDHEYESIGDYDAILQASQESPLQAIVTYNFVVHIRDYSENNTAPSCSFTYNNSDDPVIFDGFADDPDGSIVYVVWYFDDGKTESGSIEILNTSHNYPSWKRNAYVRLMVGDNGNPQKFTAFNVSISIPARVSFVSQSNPGYEVVEGTSSTYSEPQLNSYSYTTTTQNLMLPIFLKILGGGTQAASLGGDCDLKFFTVDVSGNRVTVTVEEELGDYPTYVPCADITVLGGTYSIGYLNNNFYYGSFEIPSHGSSVTLTVSPSGQGWIDIDPTDNSYTVDDVSIQASSIEGSYVFGYSESVGFGSSIVQYGSCSL